MEARKDVGMDASDADRVEDDMAPGDAEGAVSHVTRLAETTLPTRFGHFRCIVYGGRAGKEHLALTVGALDIERPVLARLHSECLTGDVFGSQRCDCGEQLAASLRELQARGSGVLLYLRQEGRGIGLANKIRAYALQERGYDTVEANLALGLPADGREYGEAAAILRDLGIRRVRLLTNNPAKIAGLERHGIAVVERLPLQVPPNPANARYLRTKREKLGHVLPLASQPPRNGANSAEA